ncbi:hypothetical protein ACS0TY_008306 [Phlomoides rotata]
MCVDIVFRNDSTRDEKCGLLTSSQHSFLELASLVFCRASLKIEKKKVIISSIFWT